MLLIEFLVVNRLPDSATCEFLIVGAVTLLLHAPLHEGEGTKCLASMSYRLTWGAGALQGAQKGGSLIS